MNYPCLVLDHDDTVVNSTATIHYASFLAFLKQVRPDAPHYSIDDYFRKNFDPGVFAFFREELGFTDEEMDEEFRFWQEFVRTRVPKAYDGIREILRRHRANGGVIAVVSHSTRENIERDYRANDLPAPDVVYGWEQPEERRKPHPWPLEEIMRRFRFRPEQLLMVDDLKAGYDMCRACGVPFAAAGWANNVPEIEQFMRRNCNWYFRTVKELDEFLQKENG